jgi:hypothetical protein
LSVREASRRGRLSKRWAELPNMSTSRAWT